MYSSTPSLTSALDGCGWSTPLPGRFTPQEWPNIHYIGGWVGPGLDLFPPGSYHRTVRLMASRYTDYAIPAHRDNILLRNTDINQQDWTTLEPRRSHTKHNGHYKHVVSWSCLFLARQPQWARASSFTRFLDRTQWRTTVGRNPLDEWSFRRRDLYLTSPNTHKRQTSMPSVGFEPTIPAGERPKTYALDRAATGADLLIMLCTRKRTEDTSLLA